MFAGLDIACLMDSRYTDGGGIIRTRDRSPKGLNPRLGDGATAGTMPTWDSARGLFTFDGGDYLSWPIAEDVGGILAAIGSLQDETYLFYFDKLVINGNYQYLFQHNSQSATERFAIRIEDTNQIRIIENNTVQITTATIAAWNGRGTVLAVTRSVNATKKHVVYLDAIEFASNTVNPLLDGKSALKTNYIGVSDASTFYLQNGTGLRFFGYARRAFTQTQLQAIQRYLRGVI